MQLGELWHQRLTPNQQKSLPNSVGTITILMSVRRHLLVRTWAVWKPAYWLALRAEGPICICCGFWCWRVFSNGPTGLGLRKLFGVIVNGDGQDTEWFSMTGVSLGCFHYFHTKVCSQIISGGDLCYVGTRKIDLWNKSRNWSLRDTVFTARSFRNYDTSLVWEWKIYYSLVL